MMTNTVKTAGYIVTDNEGAIHGAGVTADEAWADMKVTMEWAGIALLSDDADSSEELGSWTRESNLTIRPAGASLLAAIEAGGGTISWGRDSHGVAQVRP
jgi:hypothetical protein